MNKRLAELNKEIKAKVEESNALYEEIFSESEGQPSEEKETALKALNEEITGKVAEAKRLATFEEARAANGQALTALRQPVNPMVHNGGGNGGGAAAKSLGAMFAESKEYTDWFDAHAPAGQLPQGMRLPDSRAVLVASSLKTLLIGETTWAPRADASANALVPIDQRGLVDMGPWFRPLRLRELVSQGQTTSDTVEYVRMTEPTLAAAPTAEATATGDSSGEKPESAMAFEVVHDRVRSIPHWVPATRRALADAAQLRTAIDFVLRYGIEREIEDQMIAGNGTGENFNGVLTHANVLSQAFDSDLLMTARKARTELQVGGRVVPNAWVIHPRDWEKFDLETDDESRYFFGGPLAMGNHRLWGVPVVESEAVPEGTALLGDWRFAQLWDREQTTIRVSDSHAEFFIRNIIAILAETRLAFGLIRPQAIIKVALS